MALLPCVVMVWVSCGRREKRQSFWKEVNVVRFIFFGPFA